MLVLNRFYNEEIFVDIPPSNHSTRVKIAYLGQDSNNHKRARIGIDVPKEIPILRGEIHVASKK